MNLDKQFGRAELRKLLEKPDNRWQLQGMGMFRLYLTKEWRLHLWDDRFKVPNVTMIHDHPWDFDSYILAGKLTNQVYQKVPNCAWSHREETIVCGPGGGLCTTPLYSFPSQFNHPVG